MTDDPARNPIPGDKWRVGRKHWSVVHVGHRLVWILIGREVLHASKHAYRERVKGGKLIQRGEQKADSRAQEPAGAIGGRRGGSFPLPRL